MPSLRWLVVAWMSSTLALGCGLALGVDDFKPAGEGGSGAASTSTSSVTNASSSPSSSAASGGSCPADSACALLPTGWLGPAHLYLGKQAPPACSPGSDDVFTGGQNAYAPHSCGACPCGSGACAATLTLFTDSNVCASNQPQKFPTLPCSTLVQPVKALSALATAAGACGAGPVVPNKQPVKYDPQARLCRPTPMAGCPEGQSCVQTPPSSFIGPCVYNENSTEPCPGAYPRREVVSRAVGDTRGCSACTCFPTQPCTGSVKLYSLGNCVGTEAASVTLGGACV
jgi:hypothetical protein